MSLSIQGLFDQFVNTEENSQLVKTAVNTKIKELVTGPTPEVTQLPTQSQVLSKQLQQDYSGFVVLGVAALVITGIVLLVRRKKA